MSRGGNLFLSSFGQFLRVLVTAIFLLGLLPVPALAAGNGTIAGQVIDNSSSPIQDASVRAYLPASPDTFYSSLPTDISGNYSLTVPPGSGYTVEASKQGLTSANQTGISAALGPATIVNFTLLPPSPPRIVHHRPILLTLSPAIRV